MRRGLVALAVGLVVALHLPNPATAATAATSITTLCEHGQHRIVHNGTSGPAYQVRNAYFRGVRKMCITNSDLQTNFVLTRPPGRDPRGKVVAYPDIFRGCLWHVCSPNAGLPARISDVHHLKSTWHTRARATGAWNAAYDLWLGKHRMITGQADGAELMIWINHHGACCALQRRAPIVRIDGYRFYLSHWRHYSPRWNVSWNYIQFRLVHPRSRVDGLQLKPFIHRSVRLGLARRTWWLENVVAGFEVWSGGRGLATRHYSVSMWR